jgi:hypothetical protein
MLDARSIFSPVRRRKRGCTIKKLLFDSSTILRVPHAAVCFRTFLRALRWTLDSSVRQQRVRRQWQSVAAAHELASRAVETRELTASEARAAAVHEAAALAAAVLEAVAHEAAMHTAAARAVALRGTVQCVRQQPYARPSHQHGARLRTPFNDEDAAKKEEHDVAKKEE